MSAQGICDESSGLDPLMQAAFVELLREEPARGKTVFLSSHQVPKSSASPTGWPS
jgi:ABC-type multidrug transport system ATPase subunit